MIRLIRTNGDIILVNPDNIALVEPIRSGTATRLIVGRESVDVNETVEQIEALISGATSPDLEFKGDAAEPISGEEAAKLPDAELTGDTHGFDPETLTKAELRTEAMKRGLDVSGADTKEKLLALFPSQG
jgi:uncharacterized protein YlzI (FlbEa/FlbD family)